MVPGASATTACRPCIGQIAIDILSDGALLEIFDFYKDDFSNHTTRAFFTWRWITMAHVCRRWRDIVFGSPHTWGNSWASSSQFQYHPEASSAAEPALLFAIPPLAGRTRTSGPPPLSRRGHPHSTRTSRSGCSSHTCASCRDDVGDCTAHGYALGRCKRTSSHDVTDTSLYPGCNRAYKVEVWMRHHM